MVWNNTIDGLGGDRFTQPGSISTNVWVTGSVITSEKISAADSTYSSVGSFDNLNITNLISQVKTMSSVSGASFRDTSKGGALLPTAICNATTLYGYRVVAGSILMGNSISGLIAFPSAGSFTSANYFLALTAREYNVPQFSSTGSQAIYCGSGVRRASGCWIVGGSATVVDWIAVGI